MAGAGGTAPGDMGTSDTDTDDWDSIGSEEPLPPQSEAAVPTETL